MIYYGYWIGVLLLLGLLTDTCQAQYFSQYSQVPFNTYAFNPAFGGLERSLSVTAGVRSQWTQWEEGAPRSQFVNAHMPLYAWQGSVGVAFENDLIGAMRRSSGTVSYNYIQETTQLGLLSWGLRLGIQQVSLDQSQLRTPTGRYRNDFDHNDPLLSGNVAIDGIAPTWGVGLYWVHPWFELGLSLDQLPQNQFALGNVPFEHGSLWQLYATSDFQYGEKLIINPYVFLKSDMTNLQVDIGSVASYEKIFGGAALRGYNSNTIDALVLLAGAQVDDNLRLSYSFDVTLSGIAPYQEGTHEIILNYNLNKKIKTGELPKIIYNPRYN